MSVHVPGPRVEPRFARIAAVIGDPTRARMLSALLAGVSLPAGEIAQAAGITASTASQHLAKLAREGLVRVDARGRHRYFRIQDEDVARALEALSLIAERTASAEKWLRAPYRSLKYARTCYRHLAGELGVRLLQAMLARKHLAPTERGFGATPSGIAWLRDLGIDPELARAHGERYAYPCLDWSERRDHLGGRLATSLLDHFIERKWLARATQSRALNITPKGRQSLRELL